jgi:hypothetical protein
MDLPDCILDAEQKRDLLLAHKPAIINAWGGTFDPIYQTDRSDIEYEADLNEVAQSVGVDDWGLIYDSGHGSRKRGATEEDGWNECIITMPKPGSPGIQIIDDKINAILSQAQGPIFYMSDRCYSGGFSRGMFALDVAMGVQKRPRFYPIDIPEYGEKVTFDTGIGGSWGLMVSGCMEGELSYSTGRGGAWSLRWNEQWHPGMTWRQVQRAIVPALLPTAEFPQNPKLIGSVALKNRVAWF